MKMHDKINFTREYCKCRRIPCKLKGEQLYIDNKYICFSIYNFPYAEIITMIDNSVIYDDTANFFVSVK